MQRDDTKQLMHHQFAAPPELDGLRIRMRPIVDVVEMNHVTARAFAGKLLSLADELEERYAAQP